jgi:hypothetical protein
MPTYTKTEAGQTTLEYSECLYYKVNEGYYQVTDDAIMIYRPNGYDFFTAKDDLTCYEGFKKMCFNKAISQPIDVNVYLDYAASVLERAKTLTLKRN